jgi:glucose-1-phosphate adenylyltransferase
MSTLRVLTFVLAGGAGEGLQPLTRDRAAAAVPFGGRYRIIDFVLSNLWNSGLRSIYVLTQYKSQSLLNHIHSAWSFPRGLDRDQFVVAVPAQMRTGGGWFAGTADAIYQNWHFVEDYAPDVVLVFGADHIYRMDVRQMIVFHQERKALTTVACIPVPIAEASRFGVVSVNETNRIVSFIEKSATPPPMPKDPKQALASMGNYAFETNLLRDLLDENVQAASHDFGRDILPALAKSSPDLVAYDFNTNVIPGAPEGPQYWRDIGTIEAYFDASLDLKAVTPRLDLYNRAWPIRSAGSGAAPAKFVFDEDGRRGIAVQSIVGGGTILAGGYVKDSIVARNCFIDAGAEVRDSVILDGVRIGRGARVRRAIIDKNRTIKEGDRVGFDQAADRARFHVSKGGIVVIPRQADSFSDGASRLRYPPESMPADGPWSESSWG